MADIESLSKDPSDRVTPDLLKEISQFIKFPVMGGNHAQAQRIIARLTESYFYQKNKSIVNIQEYYLKVISNLKENVSYVATDKFINKLKSVGEGFPWKIVFYKAKEASEEVIYFTKYDIPSDPSLCDQHLFYSSFYKSWFGRLAYDSSSGALLTDLFLTQEFQEEETGIKFNTENSKTDINPNIDLIEL